MLYRISQTTSKLGDVISQDGYMFSASRAEDPAKPGSYYSPQKGMRLVAFEVTVGVDTGAKITANPFLDAILVDTDGFLYAPTSGRDGQMSRSNLSPGEKVKGWISFSVPLKSKLEGIKYSFSNETTLETGLSKSS
jgi:Domain of unknown function (DUF4352)